MLLSHFILVLPFELWLEPNPQLIRQRERSSNLSGGGGSRQRRLLHLLRKPRNFRRSVPIYASPSSRSRTKLQRICTTGSIGKVDTHRPKQSDFVAWAGLLIHAVTPSDSNRRLRQYLIGLVEPTWGYVQHLIHSKNSVRIDGEIALEAVSHLISMLTAAVIRSLSQARRCKHCESYAMAGAQCRKCGWEDPDYVPPVLVPRSAEEIAADLATPHTLTSDVRIRKTVNELTEPRRRSGPPNAGRRQPRR
jgi:hypothetical protein